MKILYKSIVLICYLLFNIAINAQDVNPRLAKQLKQTVDSMRQVVAANGMSVAIQFSNDEAWAVGSGVSTFSPVDSITPAHSFGKGSTAKSITAMCILQLVDEGVLSLEDSLHKWLPIYPYIDSTITIRQLLRHESGVADFLAVAAFQSVALEETNRIWEAEEVIRRFAQSPSFPVGTKWGYSNVNYVLLELIIEKVTGNQFERELEQRFFEPLGLNSFKNPAFDSISEPYAHLWLDITGDGMVDDAGSFITSWHSLFSAVSPASGYFATPTDLAKFMKKSMSGSLLTPETFAMATETVFTGLPNSIRYGLGIMESKYLGYKAYGHGGDISYSTQALYFPELDISIVVATNDARVLSWNLISTVIAILQTYLDYESTVTNVASLLQTSVKVTIFPNPFEEELNLGIQTPTSMKAVTIQLYHMDGKMIWSNSRDLSAGQNDFSFNMPEELSSGLYTLKIKSNNSILNQQSILKQ
ncbi:MAG: serine hydrolase [Bacteroidota bacterium]